MKRTRLLIAIFILPAVYLLTGCYPNKIDYVDEYDLAATHYDEEADFSLYNTFSLPDTIVHITDDEEDDSNFSREHDEFIISTVRANMLDMGYTEIESPDSTNLPDVALLVSAVSSTYYYYYYSYCCFLHFHYFHH